MDNSDQQKIVERLEKLERQNRNMKIMGAVFNTIVIFLVLAVLLVWAAVGSKQSAYTVETAKNELNLSGLEALENKYLQKDDVQKVVSAERFVLVDPNGLVRAELSMQEYGKRGTPALVLYDSEKEKDVVLEGRQGPYFGPSIRISNGKDKGGVSIYGSMSPLGIQSGISLEDDNDFGGGIDIFLQKEGYGFSIADPNGTERINMNLYSCFDYNPLIGLHGPKGMEDKTLVLSMINNNPAINFREGEKTLMRLGADDNEAALLLSGKDKTHVILSVNENGSGLGINGKNGQSIEMATKEDGEGIRFFDDKKRVRFGLGFVEGETFLVMVDKNGKSKLDLTAKDKSAGCTFYNENGLPGIYMLSVNNGSMINLFDEKARPRFLLEVQENEPALGMVDENGKEKVRIMTVGEKNIPFIELFGSQEKSQVRLTVDDEDDPQLFIYNTENKPMMGMSITKDGGIIQR